MRLFLHLFVMTVVALVVTNFYYDSGHGFGMAVPPYVYYAVAAMVAVVPVFWAITHLCGGLLLGIAGGGVLDGLRLGLMLGMGMALSKLWPSVFGAAIGVFAGGGPQLYGYGAIVVGVLLFALDRILVFFWHTTAASHDV